jgi:hypothetical protein
MENEILFQRSSRHHFGAFSSSAMLFGHVSVFFRQFWRAWTSGVASNTPASFDSLRNPFVSGCKNWKSEICKRFKQKNGQKWISF